MCKLMYTFLLWISMSGIFTYLCTFLYISLCAGVKSVCLLDDLQFIL